MVQVPLQAVGRVPAPTDPSDRGLCITLNVLDQVQMTRRTDRMESQTEHDGGPVETAAEQFHRGVDRFELAVQLLELVEVREREGLARAGASAKRQMGRPGMDGVPETTKAPGISGGLRG